jgi:Cu-Zn family superoxide dismutase
MHTMKTIFAGLVLGSSTLSQAGVANVPMNRIDDQGIGKPIGVIHAEDTDAGLKLMPDLSGLPPGPHGFHVHEFADCGAREKDGKPTAGLAAGTHYDPAKTGKHEGPLGNGHLGDMPVLTVAPDGSAKLPVTAPRLKTTDLHGRSIIIHAQTDDYADKQGGARIACGVVEGQ